MVPDNIIWAFFSLRDYEHQVISGGPEAKDVYFQNLKDEWVRVTSVNDCIDKGRLACSRSDVKYLGAVKRDSKVEVGRGQKYPPGPIDKKIAEQQRKEEIQKRLKTGKLVNEWDLTPYGY